MPGSLRRLFASAPKVDRAPSCYTRAAAFYLLIRPRAPFKFVKDKEFCGRGHERLLPIKLMRPFPSVLTLLFAMSATIAGAQTPPSTSTLEERMSQADFRAAGLDHLSPEQLKHLNEWLQTHGAGTAQVVTPGGQPVFYPDTGARDVVESHIDGTFTGWHGKSVFKLDNGQEWRQAESGAYDAGKFENPVVRIKPMLLGSWLMYVEGCGCSVRVQRIK